MQDEERERAAREEEAERIEREHRAKERDIRISLMLAGQDASKLPRTDSQIGDLQDREVANG